MKFALVTQASWSYRFGLNAILNGLDYHGNQHIDVHVVAAGLPEWYVASASSTFDFGVYLYDHVKYTENRKSNLSDGWARMWLYSFRLALDLAPQYDVVIITDCDFLVCGYLENQFKMVAGTDLLMIPCACPPNGLPIHLNGGSPEVFRAASDRNQNERRFIGVYSSPLISDPKRNIDFYESIFSAIRTTSSMRSIFMTIIEMGRVPDVVNLPVSLWCIPRLNNTPYVPRVINDRRCFFCYDDKVMMIHGKWWKEPHCGAGLAQQNAINFREECRLINTAWKLPLEWVD